MSKKVEGQFEKEMLKYVQGIELKTVRLKGFDREDVYEQIKALINKAREVCSRLTDEAVDDAEKALLEDMSRNAYESNLEETESTEEFSAAYSSDDRLSLAESTIEALQRELKAVENEARDAADREQQALKDLNSVKLSHQQEVEKLKQDLAEMRTKYRELNENKAVDDKLNEAMTQASAILREARLEGARLIDDSRAEIDQEILLGRALRREEETKAQKDIALLREELGCLAAACQEHRNYLSESQSLLSEVLDFAKAGESMLTGELDRSCSAEVNAVIDEYGENSKGELAKYADNLALVKTPEDESDDTGDETQDTVDNAAESETENE